MKKLALFTLAATIFTMPALAGEYKEYTTIEYETVDVVKINPQAGEQWSFDIGGGNKLLLNGVQAKIAQADGTTFYAPSSAYETAEGLVIFVESGKYIRSGRVGAEMDADAALMNQM